MRGDFVARVIQGLANSVQHPCPFRKNQNFVVGGQQEFVEHDQQLFAFGTALDVFVKYVGRIAEHAHRGQVALKLCDRLGVLEMVAGPPKRSPDTFLIGVVLLALVGGHGDPICFHRSRRQLIKHVHSAPSQHD